MTLEEIREQIDAIDNEILVLLAKRFEYSKMIAGIKSDAQIPIYDETRENEILNRIKLISGNDYKYIFPIFLEILNSSKNVQKDII